MAAGRCAARLPNLYLGKKHPAGNRRMERTGPDQASITTPIQIARGRTVHFYVRLRRRQISVVRPAWFKV